MTSPAILIRGDTVLNTDREFKADVLGVDGKLAALAAAAATQALADTQTLDALGRLMMPCGIDPRTHLQRPFMGAVAANDVFSSTAAGRAGGTTSIIEFVIPDPQQPLMDAFRMWCEWADQSAAEDGFHVAVTWWSEGVHAEGGELVFIVRVSCNEAAEAIARVRARGQRVHGEVLAGHLVIDGSIYRHPDLAIAAACVVSPPLCPESHPEMLWRGLHSGRLHTSSTDQCVFCTPQKAAGKDPFMQIPRGCGGVEKRTSVIFELGVGSGRLTPTEFVAITLGNFARISHLAGRKGVSAEDADADIVLSDPAAHAPMAVTH